jgi:hypothetical protein
LSLGIELSLWESLNSVAARTYSESHEEFVKVDSAVLISVEV